MTEQFVKLFETEKGQIVAIKDTDDKGNPVVRFGAIPPGLGLCWMGICFPDSDKGFDARDKLFDEIGDEQLVKAQADIFGRSAQFTPN